MHFTTVIFDMDGTLFDSERLAIDSWQAAFRIHGIEVPRQTLETVIGLDLRGTQAVLSAFAPIGVGIDDLTNHKVAVTRMHIQQHGLPVKPGAIELLRHLKDRGITVGLATSTDTEQALGNLKRVGIASYFRAIIGGDQVKNGKPHPDIYLKALQTLSVEPTEAIAVEDSDNGILAASAAGLRVVYIPDIKRIEEESRACVECQYATLMEFLREIEQAS